MADGAKQRGENQLVAWLRERFRTSSERVPVGIGDDMASVRLDGRLVAVTADMLLDAVHFDTAKHDFERIGRKAIACSLSDCAGMACEPRAALVSLALSNAMSLDDVKRLYEGMAAVADRYDCPIVGGDTTSWSAPLVIDVMILAEPMHPRGPVLRSTASAGDTIFVSGHLGGSLAGRHLDFEPRLNLARELAEQEHLHALMDISDGLAMDLHRLCEASACDAELSRDQLDMAISDAARSTGAHDGRSPLDHAMSDGEDFELLIVGEPDLRRFNLIPIGRIVEPCDPGKSNVTLIGPDGTRTAIEPAGFEHFKKRSHR